MFLGHYSPEPLGDYFAGPNHVLPTGGTARFFSPLSVDDFIKKSSFIYYPKEELEKAAPDIIHLDANESFLPLPASILEELAAAVPQVAFNRYPDPAAQELCQAFAQYYGVPVENVAAGNGSDELITVLFTGFLQKGEAFATLEPDFSMYAFNGYLQEARHVPIPKGADYAIDVDRTIQTCRQEGVKLLIFSNPGNPTSIVCPRQEVRRLI